MYRIKDLQNEGRYFANGALYKSKKEVTEQLLSYHDNDFKGSDNKDNELDIWEYLEFWRITTAKQKLDWVIEYGQWEIEKVERRKNVKEKTSY